MHAVLQQWGCLFVSNCSGILSLSQELMGGFCFWYISNAFIFLTLLKILSKELCETGWIMPSARWNSTLGGVCPPPHIICHLIYKRSLFQSRQKNAIKAIVCVLSYTELFFPPAEFLNNSRKGPGALIHIEECNSILSHISIILFH